MALKSATSLKNAEYYGTLIDTNPYVRAALETIAWAEGLKRPGVIDPYKTMVGYGTFADLSWHPQKVVPNVAPGGKGSSAAGKYQFLSGTWNEVAKAVGLKDFSPRSQDIAAVARMDQRGALTSLVAGDVDKWRDAVKNEWASIPGSQLGQGTRRQTDFQRTFNGALQADSLDQEVAATNRVAQGRAYANALDQEVAAINTIAGGARRGTGTTIAGRPGSGATPPVSAGRPIKGDINPPATAQKLGASTIASLGAGTRAPTGIGSDAVAVPGFPPGIPLSQAAPRGYSQQQVAARRAAEQRRSDTILADAARARGQEQRFPSAKDASQRALATKRAEASLANARVTPAPRSTIAQPLPDEPARLVGGDIAAPGAPTPGGATPTIAGGMIPATGTVVPGGDQPEGWPEFMARTGLPDYVAPAAPTARSAQQVGMTPSFRSAQDAGMQTIAAGTNVATAARSPVSPSRAAVGATPPVSAGRAIKGDITAPTTARTATGQTIAGQRPSVSARAAQDIGIDEGIALRDSIVGQQTAQTLGGARKGGPGRAPTIIGAERLRENLMAQPAPKPDVMGAVKTAGKEGLPSAAQNISSVIGRLIGRRAVQAPVQARQQAGTGTIAAGFTRATPSGIPGGISPVAARVDPSTGIRTVSGSGGVETQSGFRGIPDLNISSRSIFGGGGEGAAGKHLCTLAKDYGVLSDEIWRLDEAFGRMIQDRDPLLAIGYSAWAKPFADWLRKDGRAAALVRPVVFFLVWHWAQHMASIMAPKHYPGDWLGSVLHGIGSPVCRMIGASSGARQWQT